MSSRKVSGTDCTVLITSAICNKCQQIVSRKFPRMLVVAYHKASLWSSRIVWACLFVSNRETCSNVSSSWTPSLGIRILSIHRKAMICEHAPSSHAAWRLRRTSSVTYLSTNESLITARCSSLIVIGIFPLCNFEQVRTSSSMTEICHEQKEESRQVLSVYI
jgi:hypothetical protein